MTSAIEEARERAQRRAREGREQATADLTPAQAAHLTALLDRQQPRQWYVVVKDGGERVEVMFTPSRTLAEAQAWYPPRYRVMPRP